MTDLASRTRERVGVLGWLVVATLMGGGGDRVARGQVPGLPAAPKAAPKADEKRKGGTNKEEVATTTGPIKVDEVVDDEGIRDTLTDLLNQYPGVRAVSVQARQGFVTLDGQADDDDTVDDVTAFAQKVEGVRLVLNKMKTDSEVLTGPQIAGNVLRHYWHVVARNWLLAIVAVGFVALFAYIARLFARYSETLLAPFFRNTLLRSVAGSIISSLLLLAGIMIGLSVLNLTHVVLSLLGLAGVAGLAVGFAFRDIVENFIASMLLGLRRPFGIGDFIIVAGKSGSVLALDTRATTLITPEGNNVRIPNAVIYKETVVNTSITPNVLGSIEVLVPYESSTAAALEAINEALGSSDCLLAEPRPRALVQALEVNGVRLKATYWMPTKGVDGDKIQSDLRLKIKVGLQAAGITPPSNHATVVVAGPIALAMSRPQAEPPATTASAGTPAALTTKSAASIAEDNLRKDTAAAAHTNVESTEQEASPIDHAIRQAEAEAAEQGGNLLVGGNGKAK